MNPAAEPAKFAPPGLTFDDVLLQPGHSEVMPGETDIRTRIAGPTAFIQLHIEMDGEMNLLHAHEVSDDVEARLQHAFPHAEIIIHEDPAGIDERVTFPARTTAR